LAAFAGFAVFDHSPRSNPLVGGRPVNDHFGLKGAHTPSRPSLPGTVGLPKVYPTVVYESPDSSI
jgi:hypothetical protein